MFFLLAINNSLLLSHFTSTREINFAISLWIQPLAAESLASEIGEDHLAKRQLFPSFTEIRDISAHIGAAVAQKAYELGKYIPHYFYFYLFCC